MHAPLTISIVLVALTAPSVLAQVIVPINPRSSFIRINQDTAAAPVVRSLSSLSIAHGNLIRIRVLGKFTFNAAGGISRSMHAVFSSSNTVLAANLQFRVPNAIDAGLDYVSEPSFFGGLVTDVPQDFSVSENSGFDHVDVIVPPGATHLFIAVPSTFFSDNNDADNDFAAEVSVLCTSGHCCDTIDFNNDTSVFDPCDINSFLVVYSEGPCTPCGQ